MRIVLLLPVAIFLVTTCFARPIDFGSPRDSSEKNGYHPHRTHHQRSNRALNQKNSTSCYFSVNRLSPKETQLRDRFSLVTTNCSTETERWESLIGKHALDETTQGAFHEMDTVAIRGGAEYINWDDDEVAQIAKNRWICSKHKKELLTEWKTTFRNQHMFYGHKNGQVTLKCSLPNSVPGHPTGSAHMAHIHRRLTKDEANAVLDSYGVHLHMGIPLCNEHKKQMKLLVGMEDLQQNNPTASYCLRSSVTNSSFPRTSTMSEAENNYNPTDDESTVPNNRKKPKELFALNELQNMKIFELIKTLGIKYAHHRQDFSKLTSRSKMRRAAALNSIIDAHCQALDPEDAFDLREFALRTNEDDWGKWSNQQFDEIMKTVAREYYSGETVIERRSVLAIAAGSLPYSTVLQYIPNLTHYHYRQARLYAFRMSRDKKVTSGKRINELFRTDLPFGRRTLKREDGTKFDIPDVLRTIKHTEIIQLYIKAKIENGEQNETLSVSSMYKILEACKATQRKSLTCLDYYVQEADDGFDSVKNVIDHLLKNQYIDGQLAKSLNNRFLETKQYFKGDYKLRLKNVSRVGDHCIQHSLSSEEPQFSKQCSEGPDTHVHDMFCQRCEMAKETFKELIDIISQMIKKAHDLKLKKTKEENEIEEADLSEKLIIVNEAISSIDNLKRHTVRNVHIQRQRLEIIENMKDTEAFLTMDWAQKFLPKKFREAQSEYFGKSGISMHVINVLKIDDTKAPSHHNLIHVMKQDNQDSAAFLSIVEHSLTVLRKSGVSLVHLRSDNAVCYHSTGAIMSLAAISKRTGVKIASFTYSEPQGGKGAADRAANDAKKKINDYVNSGHDAETPEQVFEALTTGRVPKAMSTYLISVDPLSIGKTSMKTVPYITSFFDFWFNNDTLQMRKYGGIGTGEPLTIANFQTISGNLTVLREGGFTVSTLEFWNVVHCQTTCNKDEAKETIAIEVEEESIIDENYEPDPDSVPSVTGKHYFRCPEENCERKFISFKNLQRHIQLGKHYYQPEKEGMIDSATSIYKQRLEHWDTSSRTFFPSMENDILSSSKTIQVVKKGWALPEKRQCQRHSVQAKQFVKEKFEKLRQQRTKPDFKGIADQMKSALSDDGKTKKFAVSERLNYKQIKNMYVSFGKTISDLHESKKNNVIGKDKVNSTSAASINSKKRKSGEKEDIHEKKKNTNSRPKRDEQNTDLTKEEFEMAWIETMKIFDEIECDDSDALFDNLDINQDIVDDVIEEVLKSKNDIYL